MSNDELERKVLDQIIEDDAVQDLDAYSEMIQALLEIPGTKEILLNYLSDEILNNALTSDGEDH